MGFHGSGDMYPACATIALADKTGDESEREFKVLMWKRMEPRFFLFYKRSCGDTVNVWGY